MKKLNVLFLSLVVATFVVFNSCGDDKSGGTKNFGSEAEATAAYNSTVGYTTMAYTYAAMAADLARSFGGLNKNGGENDRTMAWTYNSSTGFWEESFGDVPGYTGTFAGMYKIRFDPADANHLPTSSTNTMQYILDFTYAGNVSGYEYDWDYNSDITTSGVSGYRAGTGNLNVDGQLGFTIGSSYPAGNVSMDYDYDMEMTDIVFSPSSDYPQSGMIEFTLRFEMNPSSPSYPNYNVSGTIEFDGDNTATVTFGGYTFTFTIPS